MTVSGMVRQAFMSCCQSCLPLLSCTTVIELVVDENPGVSGGGENIAASPSFSGDASTPGAITGGIFVPFCQSSCPLTLFKARIPPEVWFSLLSVTYNVLPAAAQTDNWLLD